ncbi:unnamed protein product, partial [Staurois parvus]
KESTQRRAVRAGEVEWSGGPGQEQSGRQGTKGAGWRVWSGGRVRNNQAGKGTKGAGWRVVRNSRGQDRRSSFRIRNQAGSRQDAGTGAHGKHTLRR